MNKAINPCIRCGKERIKGKETTIPNAYSDIKSTMYICPDSECQKKVEEELAAKAAKRQSFIDKRIHFSKKNKK
jgi:hypothetical protein